MSQNLELVRSIYAARENGDYSSIDWADPQIEYVLVDGPSPGTFTGPSELARVKRELLSPWEDVRIVVDAYRELGDEACSCSSAWTCAARPAG